MHYKRKIGGSWAVSTYGQGWVRWAVRTDGPVTGRCGGVGLCAPTAVALCAPTGWGGAVGRHALTAGGGSRAVCDGMGEIV